MLNQRKLDSLSVYFNTPKFVQYFETFGGLETLLNDLFVIRDQAPIIFEGGKEAKKIDKYLNEIQEKMNRELSEIINDRNKLLEFISRIIQEHEKYYGLQIQSQNPDFNYLIDQVKKEKQSSDLIYPKQPASFGEAGKLISSTTPLKLNDAPIYSHLMKKTQIMPRVFNESSLKLYIESILLSTGVKFAKNHISYPFMTDFLLPAEPGTRGQMTAINIITKSEYLLGSPSNFTKSFLDLQRHQKKANYRIVNIDAKFLTLEHNSHQEKLDKLLKSAK